MKFGKPFLKVVSVLLIGIILNNCYRTVAVPRNQPIHTKEKVLKLVWSDPDIDEMYMVDIVVEKGHLSGIIHTKKTFKPPPTLANIVNIYIDYEYTPPDSIPALYNVPLDKIHRIEVHDVDVGKTIFAVAGSAVAVVGIITLILLLTKESCPFIYVFNGDSYEFTGEIYSGAIYPHLERDDYLPLPTLRSQDNEYLLKMANMVREIQYTNLTELLVIDHPNETDVLIDKYGKYYTFNKLQSPRTAISANQNNILSEIMYKDDLKYLGEVNEDTEMAMDYVMLNFKKPQNSETAELVLRAKNSFWLDYIVGQFFELFGDKYSNWMEKQQNQTEKDQSNWVLDQGLSLSVYLEKNGEWQFMDYYNIVGPVAEKDIVMSMDISDIDSDELNIKLEYGYLFWEIDYAGLDFSPQLPVEQKIVKMSSAVDQEVSDVFQLLIQKDKKYYIMDEIGDHAILKYDAPEERQNMKRSLFLHSSGHYEVKRDPSGKPDVSYLKSFREPGRFGQFSKEKFLELNEQLKN